MNTRPEPRESRSVRLNSREWVLAEALALMDGENGAGRGLRAALKREETRQRRGGHGMRLDFLMDQIVRERSAGSER